MGVLRPCKETLRVINRKEKKMALREKILKYCLDYFGTTPEYPWEDEPDYAVLRNAENKKWYGLIMRISRDKLGLTGSEPIDILNVKCDPIMLGSFLEKDGFHPAYHMSKAHWLTVRLDGSVKFSDIIPLLRLSRELTLPPMKKRVK